MFSSKTSFYFMCLATAQIRYAVETAINERLEYVLVASLTQLKINSRILLIINTDHTKYSNIF